MDTATIIRPEVGGKSMGSPFVSRVKAPEPFTLVLFGATGDLAGRKLLPALANLMKNRYLPEEFAIVGTGRRDKTDQAFRDEVQKELAEFRKNGQPDQIAGFLPHVFYQRADVSTVAGMKELAERLPRLEKERGLPGNRLFYLATDPEFFGRIVEGLAGDGMIHREQDRPWARVVIEKPFGHDLASALALDRDLLRFLRPDQIYRIDHYLGKETVQNLLAFRFGNAIFEPLFNREHVDHVQITVAETVGMEGQARRVLRSCRGAARRRAKSHAATAGPGGHGPAGDAQVGRHQRCQAQGASQSGAAAWRRRRPIRGARAIHGRDDRRSTRCAAIARRKRSIPSSNTETFVAMRAAVESWRWAGVPFFLRTGKRLPRRVTEIAVQFKLPPMQLFRTVECAGDFCDLREAKPSVLVFRIQPDEGISLSFSAKRPGMQLDLHPVEFEFDYGNSFHAELPEAYERLLLDCVARGCDAVHALGRVGGRLGIRDADSGGVASPRRRPRWRITRRGRGARRRRIA